MSFGQAIKTCFRKYFSISGRAPRSEYWWFTLFLILIGGTLGFIALLVGGTALMSFFNESPSDSSAGMALVAAVIGLLAFVFYLITFIPSLTVLFRRFHDVGLSGWWLGGYAIGWGLVFAIGGMNAMNMDSDGNVITLVLSLLLNIAGIAIFIVTLLPSKAGTNKYGPPPLSGTNAIPVPPPPGDFNQS